jgi:hypothetical protein
VFDECTVQHQMAVLGRAVKLPTLELRKARRLDRDSRLIRRNDLESVAMIADPHSGDSGLAVARSLNVGLPVPLRRLPVGQSMARRSRRAGGWGGRDSRYRGSDAICSYAWPVSNRVIRSPDSSKRHLVRIWPQVEFE